MNHKPEEADVDVFEESESRPDSGEHQWVDLPNAGMLSVEDADELLRWRSASVVAVVGERNGGKTTLVTEIYERYLSGPFADHFFCHSRSLLGFEEKSFQSRAASGAALPDTVRTSAGDGLRFFHLALADQREIGRTDLLVSERAGEIYRDVRDRPALVSELVEIRHARTVAFILDGERVAQKLRRAEAFASVRNIARAFVDNGALRPEAEVQLITTKYDLLQANEDADALEVLSDFEQKFKARYSDRIVRVSTFRTAARDPLGVFEPAWGVAPLLMSWLQPPEPAPAAVPHLPELVDEFDRLLLRRSV